MKITFLGVADMLGDGYSSNMVIDLGVGGKLLYDCGSDIQHSLKDSGFTPEDINYIFVSHLHSDHSGGIEWMAYYSKYKIHKKYQLFIHEDIVDDLWQILSPSLSCNALKLEDYFVVNTFTDNSLIILNSFIRPVKNKHILFEDSECMFSYGLLIDEKNGIDNGKKVYISGDTREALGSDLWVEKAKEEINSCDLIFHEVSFFYSSSSPHCCYDKLKQLPLSIKNKMWLYHYDIDTVNIAKSDIEKDGFAGIVNQKQIFKLMKG